MELSPRNPQDVWSWLDAFMEEIVLPDAVARNVTSFGPGTCMVHVSCSERLVPVSFQRRHPLDASDPLAIFSRVEKIHEEARRLIAVRYGVPEEMVAAGSAMDQISWNIWDPQAPLLLLPPRGFPLGRETVRMTHLLQEDRSVAPNRLEGFLAIYLCLSNPARTLARSLLTSRAPVEVALDSVALEECVRLENAQQEVASALVRTEVPWEIALETAVRA